MIYLLFQLAIWLIVALLIGLFVGWWIWARRLQLTLERHNALETEHTTQANRLLAFEGDLDKAKDDARTQRAEATDLQKQLERAEDALSKSKDEVKTLNGTIKERDKTIAKLQAQLDTKAQLLDESKQQLKDTQTQLDDTNALKLEAQQRVDALNAELAQRDDALAQLDALKAKLATLEGQHEGLKKQHAEQAQALETAHKKLTDSEKSSAGALAEVALLGTTLATLKSDRADVDAQMAKLQQDLNDANKARAGAESQAKALEAQLEQKQAELDAQRKACAEHMSDLTTLLTDLATLQGQHEQLSERAQTQTRALIEQQTKLDNQRHQTAEAQTMVTQLQEQLVMLHAQLEELDVFKRQLAEQRARYDELSQAHKAQQQQLDRANLQLTTSQKEAAHTAAELTLLNNTLTPLMAEKEALTQTNAELTEALEQCKIHQVEAQQQQSASNYALAELREQHEYWRTMAKSLQQQLEEAQGMVQRQDIRYNKVFEQHKTSIGLLNAMQQHSETLLSKQNQSLESGTTYHKTQMARLDDLLKAQPNKAPQWFVAYMKQADAQRVDADELARVKAELERLELLYAQAQSRLERFANVDQEAKAQLAEVNNLNKKLQAAQSSLEKTKAELDAARIDLKAAQKDSGELHTQLQASKAQVASLNQQHESLQLALSEAKENIQYIEVPCAVCAAQEQLELPTQAAWTPPPVVAASVQADELQRIKGIGPVLETTLHDLGYRTFAQLAQWNEQDVAYVAKQLNCFPDRIVRDDWVNQAAEFATANDRATA